MDQHETNCRSFHVPVLGPLLLFVCPGGVSLVLLVVAAAAARLHAGLMGPRAVDWRSPSLADLSSGVN